MTLVEEIDRIHSTRLTLHHHTTGPVIGIAPKDYATLHAAAVRGAGLAPVENGGSPQSGDFAGREGASAATGAPSSAIKELEAAVKACGPEAAKFILGPALRRAVEPIVKEAKRDASSSTVDPALEMLKKACWDLLSKIALIERGVDDIDIERGHS